MRGQEPRRSKPIGRTEPSASLVEVSVHRVLGKPEAAADLLGAEMVIDQSQAFALARGQAAERWLVVFPHALSKRCC